jgi:uncharacterized repeat protein (TIGR03803 family)
LPGRGGINGLTEATDGNFFGTTYYGGSGQGACSPGGQPGCGTLFKITPDGTLTTLYKFCAQPNCTDGSNPFANLVQGRDGSLYGLTTSGGTNCFPGGCGTIFKISLNGSLVTLHSFDGTDGSMPTGGLIQAKDGNFYGTTESGGKSGGGTVFRITANGTLTTLYAFCLATNCTDGYGPNAGLGTLAEATDGSFYGTTAYGGTYNGGTVFRITPRGQLTTLHDFDGTDGSGPWGSVIQATTGAFYGTTPYGGTQGGSGTIFTLSTGLGPFVAFVRSYGKVGQTSGILGQGLKGTTSVALNGTAASFTVVSDRFIKATVPAGATTGYVTVTTPTAILKSNVPFRVIP